MSDSYSELSLVESLREEHLQGATWAMGNNVEDNEQHIHQSLSQIVSLAHELVNDFPYVSQALTMFDERSILENPGLALSEVEHVLVDFKVYLQNTDGETKSRIMEKLVPLGRTIAEGAGVVEGSFLGIQLNESTK